MTLVHPAYAQLRQVTANAAVVLAENPSMMTLDGTNTWILRAPGSDECVVVDPGPLDEAHLARVARLPVALTLVSHRHGDHTDGAGRFAELTGSAVRAVDARHRHGGGAGLADGEVIEAAGLRIRVLATPGHTADSLSFVVEDDRSVLTADTILGRGTTVLDDSDGDLGDYLGSLRRLIDLGAGYTVLPGHGPDLPDLETIARGYLDHREERLDQVRAALRVLGDDATPRSVVEHVYADVDPSLWPVAEKSVNVQLEYLRSFA
ncbi:MBL fold metallo-hydrolase [Rhodococcus aetherivorans]|uniref:MBL fold metallo-hydrolase n=1 Tax=Rhodococcus aetherivorans TaxID=191292 RepID=UPI001E315BA1|nr:MBL fold metallo-hydrolase [Rhodococcus aetherivorans]UGQ40770.1 MBL fold metallo-hydrolase [Rhodococcus aetherivorans]